MAARVTQLCDAIAASITAAFQGTDPGQFGEAFAARSETHPRLTIEEIREFTVYVTPSSVAGEQSTRDSFDHQTVVEVVVVDPFDAKPNDAEVAKRAFLERVEGLRDHLETVDSPGDPELDVALTDIEHDPLLDPELLRSQPRICLSIITCTYLS